jgi:DNA-binding NtrC family response regulator
VDKVDKVDKAQKVLVVDDEVDILSTVKLYLKDNYEILTAENAREALLIFQSEKPAVIITDIRMPGMSGIELMRRVKSAENNDAEVLVITGHGDMDIAVQAVRLGAVDFLVKPIDMKRLKLAVKRALEKAEMKRGILEYIDEVYG